MKLEEAIAKAKISKADVARILGKTPGNITNRLKTGSEITVAELLAIEKATGLDLIPRPGYVQNTHDLSQEVIEIDYLHIEGVPQTSFKNRLVNRIYLDKEIVENTWKYKPEDLRGVKMLGDKMAGGDYPLKNEDVLLVDITQTNPLSPGVYVFSTHGKNVFICGVMKTMEGNTKFYFYNQSYPDKILTDEQMRNAKLTIIGRVIKNLSLRI